MKSISKPAIQQKKRFFLIFLLHSISQIFPFVLWCGFLSQMDAEHIFYTVKKKQSISWNVISSIISVMHM